LFLEEARRILQQLNEATERAQRVARGQSRTLRVGLPVPHDGAWLDQLPVALNSLALAAPAAHPLSKFKNLRLRDMTEGRFIWFPRRESTAFYDRLMFECFRGGLKSLRIVQEASNEATTLTLVAQDRGVGFVVDTARWRCPDSVVILKVADLELSLPLALVWRGTTCPRCSQDS
jgi:DNA-binding transcriptional LysR family regulator